MPASNPKEAKLDDDVDESFDSTMQIALEDIDACQNEIHTLNEAASEEILAVDQKFNKLRRPHYNKRNEFIQKIPNFWYTAFINHPQISSVLGDEEQECLQHLLTVDVEEFEDIKSGYKIVFNFSENDYFTNSKLEKEFHLATSGKPESKSTPIEWKEGKDLTKTVDAKNGRKRRMGLSSSFFAWFSNNVDPITDEIAEVIKDDMWSNPLQYYLASEIEVSGENGQSDDDDDEEGDENVYVIDGDEDDDEDDSGEEGDPDEDDDDDEDVVEAEEEDDDVEEVSGESEDSEKD